MHIVFRNVSFQYPDKEKHALQNVSFKIEAGQLCVCTPASAMLFITVTVGDCWGEWFWKEYDLETDCPHLRPNRGLHPHQQLRHQNL